METTGETMEYELIREIFNKCSGNQMRDVFVEEITTDDPRKWVENYLSGKTISIEEYKNPDGSIVFDVDISGLKQRFSFTPI